MHDPIAEEILNKFDIRDDARVRLKQFVEAVESYPGNLVGWSHDALWLRGIADSLALWPWVPHGGRALDIGSGAGFPGLVLQIVFPDVHWTLVESRSRRAIFLQETVDKLGIKHVKVILDRAEGWIRREAREREAFDLVTLRAVAPTAVSLELGLPFCAVGGRVAIFKSARTGFLSGEEAALAAVLGGRMDEAVPGYAPDATGQPDQILLIQKVSSTPAGYPRAPQHLGRAIKK